MTGNKILNRYLLSLALGVSAASANAAIIERIDFQGKQQPQQVVVKFQDSEILTYQSTVLEATKQLIIEIPEAKFLSKNVSRAIDTSSFDSPLKLVTSYLAPQGNSVRLILQLRKVVSTPILVKEGKIFIGIGAEPSPELYTQFLKTLPQVEKKSAKAKDEIRSSQSKAMDELDMPVSSESESLSLDTELDKAGGLPKEPTAETSKESSSDQDSEFEKPNSSTFVASEGKDVQKLDSNSEKTLENASPDMRPAAGANDIVERAAPAAKYVGRKITLQVKDAELQDVFRLIGDASGFNIVLSDEVKGKVTLSLVDVPWDLAFETILSNKNLGSKREQNIMRIMPLVALVKEENEKAAAKIAAEQSSERITRIFPVNYADPQKLVPILAQFGDPLAVQHGVGGVNQAAGAAAAGVTAAAGATPQVGGAVGGAGNVLAQGILVDTRTHSIIVQQTEKNLIRIGKLIELLDIPTPQVEIEARIVEAKENFGREISGSSLWGFEGSGGDVGMSFLNFGSGFVSPLTSIPVSADDPTKAAVSGVGFGLNLKKFKNSRLNALLAINESEGTSKIISAPRLVVLNTQTANILQSTPVTFLTRAFQNGNLLETVTTQQANLSLNVTPTVTNDGNILMDIKVSNDVPELQSAGAGTAAVANRNIDTRVMTESGETLVIGGVYSQTKSELEEGIPWVRKIPVIGWLFGNSNKRMAKTELILFITPKLVNPGVLDRTRSYQSSAQNVRDVDGVPQ